VLALYESSVAEPPLHIGSKAPSLSVEGWLKGGEVGISPGTILIVETWATWCKPCVDAMPHLSALAKRHQSDGLSVVAINVESDNLDVVRAFVRDHDGDMAYPVGYDSSGRMQADWIAGAGMAGLPASFIVGRDGTIAWAGHPEALDGVVQRILRDDWSLDEQRRLALQQRLAVPYAQTAVALLAEDSAKAYELIEALMQSVLATESEFLQGLAYHIFAAPGVLERDLEVAYAAASIAGDLEDWRRSELVELMSKIREAQGRRAEAIALQRYAAKIDPRSSRMDERLKALLVDSASEVKRSDNVPQ
jgi:thiol-disulfide isomerase/thioredoxin